MIQVDSYQTTIKTKILAHIVIVETPPFQVVRTSDEPLAKTEFLYKIPHPSLV